MKREIKENEVRNIIIITEPTDEKNEREDIMKRDIKQNI